MRLLATACLLLALPAPARAQLANDKGPSLAVVVERCFGGAGGPADRTDGSWVDQLDWGVLCELAQDAFEGGGRTARAGSGDPDWAAGARTAFDAQWPQEPEDDVARLARERQRRAMDAGVEAIQSLTEPWDDGEQADTVRGATLELHLYARIFDDAVDEGGKVHRQQALAAQNLLWRSCTTLALADPGRRAPVQRIIAETVEAAAPHSSAGSVARWGKKNHHLLVAPALLAPTSTEFDGRRTDLSWGLWALQVSSELREELSAADIAAIRDVLTTHDHPAHIRALRSGGWSRLSEVYLIGVLQAIAVVRENE
jgi:hypothetical protein